GTLSFNEAIVTEGGIPIKEINPRTMESKVVKNLYFAGEIIEIQGPEGGFNLQKAFSTGWFAGRSAALSL
ncbi:MAG: NAD(P)/FAD-dependent oxidoreductase, partial [Candidatus Humimicrobiaceae bacterium]